MPSAAINTKRALKPKPIPRQTSFLAHPEFERFTHKAHGGSLHLGQRKEKRPLDPKRPIHLVMRSSRAKGEWSFLRPSTEVRIKKIVYSQARKFQVEIKQYANSGNHLHILMVAK